MTDTDRGIHIADGGFASVEVHYPDPERIAWHHRQWADKQTPYEDQ